VDYFLHQYDQHHVIYSRAFLTKLCFSTTIIEKINLPDILADILKNRDKEEYEI